MGVLRDIGRWLWHLVPGNPIMVRVVATGGKRVRHLWARLIYLVLLMGVFLLAGGLLINAGNQSLNHLAKQMTQTFMYVSVVQLFLMSFIAPVFCAGAITQEKDANTYHILLTTPMSNGQIVLGSLLSRLLFVWALLLSGLPIFCITMIYGGVTTAEIFESFGLAACTGLITGSIAIMISFLRVGTRRTIFAFFIGVAVYLIAVYAIGLARPLPRGVAPEATGAGGAIPDRMSWLAPVHPFLSLLVVTGQTPAPAPAAVYRYGWPTWWLLAYPQYGYMLLTTLASALMVLVSLIYVRRGSKEGETTIFSRLRERFAPIAGGSGGERRHKPRRVWTNPIAWREAATRASAGGRSLLRPVFMALALLAGVVLLIAHEGGHWGLSSAAPQQTRFYLTALIWIELAVVLLVVTNTAATTLTREKESLTIELLLSTPLTSRYIIAGMLQGLVRLVVPLIGVPLLTLMLFALVDLFRTQTPAVIAYEAVIMVPVLMVAFAALAAMIGLHFSLLSRKTVQAVMISTCIVLGAAGLLYACALPVVSGGSTLAAVVLPFTPFPAIQSALDPWRIISEGGNTIGATPATLASYRWTQGVFSAIAAAVYLGITYAVYTNMVRNFDMTVRRQSA